MKMDILKEAKEFFNKVKCNHVASTDLNRWNKNVQFLVTDGVPFYVEVENGNIKIVEGKVKSPDMEIESDSKTYEEIFNGDLTVTDAAFENRLFFFRDPSRKVATWALRLLRYGRHKEFWE